MKTENKIITVLYIDNNSLKNNMRLQLSKIEVNPEYAKKWNTRNLTDFVCLTNNGELLRPTLYRVGGLNSPKVGTDRYFMLLKYVEAFYSKEILKSTSKAFKRKETDPRHLESRWCILDRYGNEKVEFNQFSHPYLVKNSCIYSIDKNYYNIETGFLYCYASGSLESQDFLFLENNFDNDESKRGVLKINKKDGTFELFSKK